jgi:hypothetical protein
MLRRLRPVLLLAVAFALLPGPLHAKAPTRKEIDEALMVQPIDALVGVREAQDAHREGEQQLARIQQDLDVAWLDLKAAKAWVDAGEGIIRAVETDQKAAEKGNRTEDLASLAAQLVRSEGSLTWRKARHDAAKSKVDFQQRRVAWGKAELERLDLVVQLSRLQAYDVAVGGDPEVIEESGRVQTKLGRQAQTEGKDRQKMERAEADWQQLVAKAASLNPTPSTDARAK